MHLKLTSHQITSAVSHTAAKKVWDSRRAQDENRSNGGGHSEATFLSTDHGTLVAKVRV